MAVSPGPKVVLVLLLTCGLLNSSPLDLCPEFCTCQPFLHLNCSTTGLFVAPLKINPSIIELDFSNNQLGTLTFQSKYYNLQKVWLGNNSMSQLSLCVDVDLKGQSKSRLRRRWGCLLWAPTLQLLSVERNQLEKFPEGLGQQRSLQILHLSFNKISMLEQRDFSHLKQLEELHLQHNLISSLHPQIFEKLYRLKVLDLSFNMLTTLHPVTYISLNHIGADVALRGNSWICDCGMRFLQRRMVYDNNKGLKMLNFECASPLALSGRNLQELNDEDLECQDSDIHRDVTVHRGSEMLLTCSEPDAAWWTPKGETTRIHEQGSLFITDITEQDEGLYVCLSKSHQILSLYNLQILEQNRSIRSVSNEAMPSVLDKMVQTRTTVTPSHFAMAVSLSVIITFIIAFILGVLLQPYICACWQKIKTKKQKPQTNPVPNTQQEQYVNDAYLHCEDVDDFEPYRERRVTFTEHTEDGNMQYYDTVAGDAQEGNGAVIGPGQANSDSSDDSGREAGMHNHRNVNNLGKKIEFEIIPDSTERNSFSSQSSKSSIGDKIVQENFSEPNTTQAIEEQIQKTAIAVPQISFERPNEIPGFISEPFSDWYPHGNDINIVDPDLDDGEQFEYSDSVRSGSPISPNSSFKQPNLNVPNVDKKISLKSSSSSSDVSDSEPTHYTVNPDSEEKSDIFEKRASNKSSSSCIDSTTESHHAEETWPAVDLEHIPTIKRRLIFKTVFVDSYNKDTAMKNELQQQPPLPIMGQTSSTIKKRKAPLPPPRKSSSCSSDSDEEIGKFKQEKKQLETKHDLKVVYLEQGSTLPVVHLKHVSKVERRLDFKVRYAASESFSGSDNQEENIYEELKEQIPSYSKQESTTATTEIKQMSGTSSSSESDDERVTKEEQENYYENIQLVTSQKKQPIVMLEQGSQWPVINLVKIPKVKRRLDLKTDIATVDAASSSGSEEEQIYVNVQGKVPTGVVNVLRPESGTSSSSESEDEQGIKVNQEILQQATSPIKPPPVVKPDLESQWPVISLVRIPKVKRRLDITERLNVGPGWLHSKTAGVPKTDSGTSSSSESEDEQEIKIKQHQGKIQMVTSSNIRPTETQWPVINLVKIPKVKKRLDIKERESAKVIQVTERVPPGILNVSETSSSSESEDEQVKVNQTNIQEITSPMTPPTAVKPNQASQWPVVNLVKVHKVKRRLDIKTISAVEVSSSSGSEDAGAQVKVIQTQGRVPSTPVNVQKPQFETSSSSESEDEQIRKATKENPQQIAPPNKQPTEQQYKSKWAIINLVKIPKVKRRLDIKERVTVRAAQAQERVPSTSIRIPKQDSVTSSSSDSDNEQKTQINHQEIVPPTMPPTGESQWPMIDLVRMPKLKRRLDIKERVHVRVTQVPLKVPSTTTNVQQLKSDTSSSSESEDEEKIKVKVTKENLQQIATLPKKQPVESQWPLIDLVTIPKVKRHLDIKEKVTVKVTKRPERFLSTSSKISKQYSGTSSSSESEEDHHHYENIHQVTSSAKQLEPNTQWPEINLVKLPKLKQRLDIIPDVNFYSSSSDSEDEQANKTQVQGKFPSRPISVKPESGTSSSIDREDEHEIRGMKQENVLVTSQYKQPMKSQWPVVDLVKIPQVKRRLDIKERVTVRAAQAQERVPSTSIRIPKQDSVTSSSSDSDNEQKIQINHQKIVPPTMPPKGESQWPMINLVRMPKLKRRLDIKERVKVTQVPLKVPSATANAQQLKSDTSSSSESEDEETMKVKVTQENLQQIVTSPTKQPAESQWPIIDLVKVPKINRRLDIKTTVPETDSSSSDSEDEEVTMVQVRVPSTNNSIQRPTLGTSFSSESGNETIQKVDVTILGSKVESQTQWPVVDLGGITQLKRRLDFKIPSQSSHLPVPASGGSSHIFVSSSSSSSDEDEKVVMSTQISAGQTTRLPSQTSLSIPHISRRLDIKGPPMKPGLQGSDSSSSSDDEKNKPKLSSGSLKYEDNKSFIKVSPILTIPRGPTKTTPSVQLEKYTIITDDLRDKATSGTTSPVVTPELQSKWATMNLGHSRFRKRLDITKTSNPPPSPSSPPPSSPKQDKLITGIGMVKVTEQVSIATTREQTLESSSSSESEDDSKLDSKSSVAELDSVSPQVNLTSMLQVKRSLHFTTKQNKSSSSSSNDEDMADIRVPDLSQGIPRIKRRLNIKAPTPPPSISSSDDEKLYAHKFSDVTDQRSIEYKRTIMKTFSNDSYTTNRDIYRQPLYVESSPQTPKKLSLDNIKRKLMPSKQNELPPNLRWTSVGSHLSEYPVPVSKRPHDGFTSSPPLSSPPPISKDNSSDSSSSEDEQKEVKTTLIVTQKTNNPRSVTFNSSPTILNAATFEDGTERRGLRALKAMSSDRKTWDSEFETFTESVPISVDYTSEHHTVYRRTVDVKTKISQPLTYSSVSPTFDERRRADMLYGIPSYKRHTVKSIELSQGPPPPVPSTPLPDENTDFKWRSPQTSLSRGGFVQKKTTEEESVDDPFYDNPNISAV